MHIDPSLERVQINGLDLLVDRSAREQGVAVAFSDRSGGVSPAPFNSLNLSTRSGDAEDKVMQNRARLMAANELDEPSLAFARQVHGCGVIDADAGPIEGTEGDVVVTRQPRVPIGVLTADCVPVVVLGEEALAVIHAGWRGLVAGAIERGVEAVGRPVAGWVGPSIHSCCYEVGPDVVSAFEEKGLPIADSWHVDPGRAAFVALKRAGVEKIAAAGDCTSCDTRYFSYRRDRVTGRQSGIGALLWT